MNWVGLVLAAAALGYGVYLIINRRAEGDRAERRLERGGRLGAPAAPGARARQAAVFGAGFVIIGLVGIVFSLNALA